MPIVGGVRSSAATRSVALHAVLAVVAMCAVIAGLAAGRLADGPLAIAAGILAAVVAFEALDVHRRR